MAKTPLCKCELLVARRARIRRIQWLIARLWRQTEAAADPELRRLWGNDSIPISVGATIPDGDGQAEHAYHTNAHVRSAVVTWRHERKYASTLEEIRKAWEVSGFVEETL